MAIRTKRQYLEGLRDDRRVHYQGRLVDVLEVPELRAAADRSGIAFDVQHDPSTADLAVVTVDGEQSSAMYTAAASVDDLLRRSQLIELQARLGGGTIVLKEVGSDALFALLRVLRGEALERARLFVDRCRRDDLALAVAQTDVKGDRGKSPTDQADPDMYLRIVDEDESSIVVRGAKCHTSFSPHVDELIVLPTRALAPAACDYAVSFAIPVDTEGLHLYVSPYLAGPRNDFEHPVSSRYKIVETLTVFDDVVVPKERVFVAREAELAGPLALAFVDYHRFTAVSYKLALLDLIVGAAWAIADANGISKAGHVKTKITELIVWSEAVRGLTELAARRSSPDSQRVQVPDQLMVNTAKYTFAHGYQAAVGILMDLAGGLLVTGPGAADWEDPTTRLVLEKYFAAAVPAQERLRLMHLIADLTARDFGGYQAVLATHAEGSLEAERMQIFRSYNPARAVAYARSLAGL